jgi:hypothetical protein
MRLSRLLCPALPVVAVALAACGGDATRTDVLTARDLPAPSLEVAEPFSSIAAATEWGPDRLVVVDGTDGEVSVVTLTDGTRQTLGRRGGGPGEYTVPAAAIRLPGDTLVVLDIAASGGGGSARTVRYLPDLSAGSTGTLMLFNLEDTSVVQGTMFPAADGTVFSTAIKLSMGPSGPIPSDTMQIVRFALSPSPTFTRLGHIRTPQTGTREQQVNGNAVTIKAPFPGLVTADAWTAFPDGRLAIIRGEGYQVEFVAPNGTVSAPVAIPYERIPVTVADQEQELATAREQLATAMLAIRRTLPPGVTLDVEITPPPSWPTEYPPISALVAYPAPNGDVWVRRATPARVDRELWDVIDPAGALVARWQLPKGIRLVTVGDGAVYTARVDDDDLNFLQRVVLPR